MGDMVLFCLQYSFMVGLTNTAMTQELRLKVGCVVMLLVNLRQPDRCKSLSPAGDPWEYKLVFEGVR